MMGMKALVIFIFSMKRGCASRRILDEKAPRRVATAPGSGLKVDSAIRSSVSEYAVATHTHELAVRMALGARRRDLVRLVLRRARYATFLGIGLGIAAALMVGSIFEGIVYGVGEVIFGCDEIPSNGKEGLPKPRPNPFAQLLTILKPHLEEITISL